MRLTLLHCIGLVRPLCPSNGSLMPVTDKSGLKSHHLALHALLPLPAPRRKAVSFPSVWSSFRVWRWKNISFFKALGDECQGEWVNAIFSLLNKSERIELKDGRETYAEIGIPYAPTFGTRPSLEKI